jgi:hypothetical protein
MDERHFGGSPSSDIFVSTMSVENASRCHGMSMGMSSACAVIRCSSRRASLLVSTARGHGCALLSAARRWTRERYRGVQLSINRADKPHAWVGAEGCGVVGRSTSTSTSSACPTQHAPI